MRYLIKKSNQEEDDHQVQLYDTLMNFGEKYILFLQSSSLTTTEESSSHNQQNEEEEMKNNTSQSTTSSSITIQHLISLLAVISSQLSSKS